MFLAFETEKPATKQYMEMCHKNVIYNSFRQ